MRHSFSNHETNVLTLKDVGGPISRWHFNVPELKGGDAPRDSHDPCESIALPFISKTVTLEQ
jgi:hypothetical protein